jgi:hypothetical protein
MFRRSDPDAVACAIVAESMIVDADGGNVHLPT